jgi:arylformamidase
MTMPLGAVRGGIAISGLYDLEPIRLNYLNEKLGLDEAEAQRTAQCSIFRRWQVRSS